MSEIYKIVRVIKSVREAQCVKGLLQLLYLSLSQIHVVGVIIIVAVVLIFFLMV